MRKIVIKIFNLVFLALTAVALTAFATKPFVALDVSIPLTKEFVVEKLDGQFSDNIKKEDIEEAFKDGVTAKINLEIDAKSIFKSLKDDTAVTQSVQSQVNSNVNGLVDALHAPLNVMFEKVAKNTVNEQAKENIIKQIENCLPKNNKDEASNLFEERVDEQDVNNITDEMFNAIKGGEATVDSIVENMSDDINKILADIEKGEAENPTGFTYSEFDPNSEQGTQIKNSLTDALNEYGLIDSEGKITDADTAMGVIISKLLENPSALAGGDTKTENTDNTKPEEQVNSSGDIPEVIPEKAYFRDPLPKLSTDKESYEVMTFRDEQVVVNIDGEHEEIAFNILSADPVDCIEFEAKEPGKENNIGIIRGIKEGEATISVSCPGFEDSDPITVKVNPLPKEIKFVNTPLVVNLGKTRKLSIERNETVDASATVTYTLSDVSPADSITLEGDVLTGNIEGGTAKVTAECDGVTLVETVTCNRLKTLKESLHDIIDGYIKDAKVYEAIDNYGKYIIFGLIALMIPWVLFAIITIIRIIRREKCWTKPWVVFFFASLQLILGLGLTLLFSKFKDPVVDLLGGIGGLDGYIDLIKATEISFKFSCFLPSILFLAMIPLTIVYMIICHKQKKDFKANKKARKAAKRAS